MAPRAGGATLAGLVDDFSEDEFAREEPAVLTPDSAAENRAPARKTAQKPAKKTAGKAPARRASGTSVLGPKKAAVAKKVTKAPAKRSALAERQTNASDTEEVDEFDEDVSASIEPPKATKRGRPPKPKTEESMAPKAKGKAAAAKVPATKKGAKAKKGAEVAIPETQKNPENEPEPDEMDVEPSIEMDEIPETQPVVRAAQRSARQGSLQPIMSGRPRPATGASRRPGSASDTERGDPMLRRKLGEMTKKFENIDLKYRQLREVGMQDKESNFDKLKRATDKREQDQNNIIASLKRQLEEQKALANESKTLRTEITSLTTENKRLTTENKTLSKSLSESQNESKALSTKLAASRAQSTEPTKASGSAVKQRFAPAGNEDTIIRQLKEDLYSDLTGLIIRNIKKAGEDDVYDCIQTGRNGTLHFHLTVSPESAGAAYEDVEFAYTPHLDEKRDKELFDILPDYLMEEICFPRNNAAKFYAKIVECITKKIIIED